MSFGPTARLSFSSLGRGMGGTGAGIFGEVRTYARDLARTLSSLNNLALNNLAFS